MLRVDGEVGHFPELVVLTNGRHALLNGILVGTGEGGVDELADVGVAGVNRKTIGVFGHVTNLVDVADVEFRIDALRKEVHRQGHDVNVAGSLAITKEGAFDAVGPGQYAQLGRRDGRATVVMGVQREYDRVASVNVPQKPLNSVGVEIRCVHLNRCGKIQDERPLFGGLNGINNGVANLHRVLEFSTREGLG